MKKLSSFVLIALLAAAILVVASCASQGGAKAAGGPSGTASATAQGFGGDVTVTITLTNGKITAVEAVGDGETEGIGSMAIGQLPGDILAKGTVEVDAVAGASVSSGAVLSAAREALGKIK
jgi:fumarate reductase flavoprotein subunit